MLLPVKTRLPDIQTRLKKILPHDAVLVGHSLNADLQALQVSVFSNPVILISDVKVQTVLFIGGHLLTAFHYA